MLNGNRSKMGMGLGLLWGLVLLAGCASYHPVPLSGELEPLAMGAVRVQANAFSHPLLKPVVFDERDGLSADEAAVLAVLANPELRVARDRRGVASAQLLQAGILPNPTLSAGFDVPAGGNTSGRVTGYGLGLDWEVTALLAHHAQKEAAGPAAPFSATPTPLPIGPTGPMARSRASPSSSPPPIPRSISSSRSMVHAMAISGSSGADIGMMSEASGFPSPPEPDSMHWKYSAFRRADPDPPAVQGRSQMSSLNSPVSRCIVRRV